MLDKTNYSDLQITVYVANLAKRKDRLAHIKKQFDNKKEFDVHFIEAVEHEIGDLGLWMTFKKCIKMAVENNEKVIIFCEDDHSFTEKYSPEILFDNIVKGSQKQADLLIGGSTGGFNYVVPISERLFWINHYWSNQFLVIYAGFFSTILDLIDFDYNKKLDNTLSELTVNKLIMYPYISVQKNFNYSDVTEFNNKYPEQISKRFENAEKILGNLNEVYKHYH